MAVITCKHHKRYNIRFKKKNRKLLKILSYNLLNGIIDGARYNELIRKLKSGHWDYTNECPTPNNYCPTPTPIK